MKRVVFVCAALMLSVGCSKSVINEDVVIDDVPVNTPVVEDFSDAIDIVEKALPDGYTVHFDFDSYNIRPVDLGRIHRIASDLSGRYDYRLELIGGACPIGEEEYNINLGKLRAEAVADVLLEKLPPEAMVIISVGERHLVSDDPAEYEKNRRCEITIKG